MLPSEFLRTIWICEPPKGTLEVSHVESAMKLYLEHEAKWISVDIQPKIEKNPYQIICKSPNNKLVGMKLKKDIFHLKWIGKNEPDFVRFCDKFNISEWRYFL